MTVPFGYSSFSARGTDPCHHLPCCAGRYQGPQFACMFAAADITRGDRGLEHPLSRKDDDRLVHSCPPLMAIRQLLRWCHPACGESVTPASGCPVRPVRTWANSSCSNLPICMPPRPRSVSARTRQAASRCCQLKRTTVSPLPVSLVRHQMMACNPLSAMTLSSLRAGPVGWVSPCSHLRTVEAEVCK